MVVFRSTPVCTVPLVRLRTPGPEIEAPVTTVHPLRSSVPLTISSELAAKVAPAAADRDSA